MARTRKVAWSASDEGFAAYKVARAEAQAKCNADGYDRGIEANDLFRQWHTFLLPQKRNRYGHELACEVVSCERLENCKPGHGPNGGR